MAATETSRARRERIRRLRRALPADEQRRRAGAASLNASALDSWHRSARVGVYLDVDGELGTTELIAALQALGATCHVPVLDDNRLRFAPFGDTTSWSPNRYGILEPDGTGSAFVLVEGAELDLVFVPAVAVDVRGNRVGMGAGWYDRTFAGSGTSASGAGPTLVGFVHDEQVVDTIEPNAWDVAMHELITPTRLLRCPD